MFAYGPSEDYFVYKNCIGFVRLGDEQHAGCAVILSNLEEQVFDWNQIVRVSKYVFICSESGTHVHTLRMNVGIVRRISIFLIQGAQTVIEKCRNHLLQLFIELRKSNNRLKWVGRFHLLCQPCPSLGQVGLTHLTISSTHDSFFCDKFSFLDYKSCEYIGHQHLCNCKATRYLRRPTAVIPVPLKV